MSALGLDTKALLDDALATYAGSPQAADLADARRRLDGPLRVAIAGRVKAGKSTLLNALVGERLAPTDAGECTRIVTWYEDGHTYRVLVHPKEGSPHQARFARADGALEIDLGGADPERIDRLEVMWPSSALRTTTLIDTPGIGSLSDAPSGQAWAALAPGDRPTAADAVLYLVKHLHGDDVEFLRAFHDTTVANPNPVNAVAVLSRADEISVGRIDSMASARRIAGRLAGDPAVRRLAQTVVPVAGLLAETAASLTEAEFQAIRVLAELPPRELEALLLSADRFVSERPDLRLTSLERRHLLDRFGVFGVRLATAVVRRGVVRTAGDLSVTLRDRSGLDDLRALLQTLFVDRSEVLRCRSALLALDRILRRHPVDGSARLAGDLERVLANAHPFQELRVIASVRSGWVSGPTDTMLELERLLGGQGTAITTRLDLDPGADPGAVRTAAVEHLLRWKRRVENPLTSRELVTAGQVAIRSLEGMLAGLPPPPPPPPLRAPG